MSLLALTLLTACFELPEAPPVAPPAPSPEGPPAEPTPSAEPTPDAFRAELQSPPDPAEDYPTAEAAGTESVYLLEEPDRGPWVKEASVPSGEGLSWSTHRYCEPRPPALACGPATAEGLEQGPYWRIGRKDGRPVQLFHHHGNDAAEQVALWDWREDGTLAHVVRLDGWGEVVESLHFGPKGQRFKARKLDGSNGLPGCGMLERVLDAEGHLDNETCLDWSGQPMRDTTGVIRREYSVDAAGFPEAMGHRDHEGTVKTDHAGVARAVYERDAQGRLTRTRHLAPTGTPAVAADPGCAEIAQSYQQGRLHRRTCGDGTGTPVPDADGVVTTEYRYDEGCVSAEIYLAAEGEPQANRLGVQHFSTERDAHCAVTRSLCYDDDGDHVPCEQDGAPVVERVRDGRGRIVEERHLLANGDPLGDPSYGVPMLRTAYDSLGREIRKTCHQRDGSATECGSTGFHGWVKTWDDAGRMTQVTYLDPDGSPGANLGTARREFAYDSFDHVVTVHSYGVDGAPVQSDAIERTLYAPGHQRFAVLLYSADGTPHPFDLCFTHVTCVAVTWHAVRIRRADNGRVTHNTYFDTEGQEIVTVSCKDRRCFE